MTKRAPFITILILTGLYLAAAPAAADSDGDARPTLFVASTHGGDAQMHPGLPQLGCLDCPQFPTANTMDAKPQLATLALSLSGTQGHIRGGIELFGTLSATGRTSGYTGLVTYVGFEFGPVYAVGGVGWGTYLGGLHTSRLSAMAGIARTELGVHVAKGFAVAVRSDLIENNLSTARTASLGLIWAPE